MNISRVVVAGASSGVGKTTISLALMYGLRKRGYKVQPFKIGPDFIDPTYHMLVTGSPSRNLDVWMMRSSGVIECFQQSCQNADIAVIEGVMGLFDGLSGRNNFASTSHVANILKAPVVLVVDASKAARSVAAIILGFLRFDRSTRIAGVILNNVASDRHAGYLQEAIVSKLRVPILGIIRRDLDARMKERHLGLVPAPELDSDGRKDLMRDVKKVAEQIDIDRIVGVCKSGPLEPVPKAARRSKYSAKIAVALDESFNFYYQDNLDALRASGAHLRFFSPVHDSRVPNNVDGIILGGGFPEVLADRLEKNTGMMKSIRKSVGDGTPAYAECGGLMYLSRSIRGYVGSQKKRKMVGLVDADTAMTGKLTLNYTEASCHGPFFGTRRLRGHEFHYSQLEHLSADCRFAYRLSRGNGIAAGKDGIILEETGLAAYNHLHFASGDLAGGIVKACAKYSRR